MEIAEGPHGPRAAATLTGTVVTTMGLAGNSPI